jgi:hypothetical protein
MNKREKFVTRPNFTVYNCFNNEKITGDLINTDEIEGKHFFVMMVNGRMLKLAKDAYSPKRMFIPR